MIISDAGNEVTKFAEADVRATEARNVYSSEQYRRYTVTLQGVAEPIRITHDAWVEANRALMLRDGEEPQA